MNPHLAEAVICSLMLLMFGVVIGAILVEDRL